MTASTSEADDAAWADAAAPGDQARGPRHAPPSRTARSSDAAGEGGHAPSSVPNAWVEDDVEDVD